MGRRKIHHAKSNETNEGTGAVKTPKQQHSKTAKQEKQSTKSKNNGNVTENVNDKDIASILCASEEKPTMQPISDDGLSKTTTKNAPNISSALLIINRDEKTDETSQSASTSSNVDQDGTGNVRVMDVESLLPVTPKKNRRKVVRKKDATSAGSAVSQSATATPSPTSSPSSVQQTSSQMSTVLSNNGQFICPSCNKVIDSQSEYTRHIRQHNFVEASATTHTCSLCGKVLSSASSLDRHMLVHSGERPFKCRICGMAFTTNGNMHRHMRTHHDGAPVSIGDASSAAHVSDDENTPTRKARTYVKRKRLQAPLKTSIKKGSLTAKIVPIRSKMEGGCDDSGAGHEDEWGDTDDKSSPVPDTAKSIRSFSPSPQKRKCSDTNNILLEKLDDAANNNWTNGSSSIDLDESLRCLVCCKTFLSKMGLHSHLDGHLPNEFLCKLCKDSKEFPTYQALHKHCRINHTQALGALKSEGEGLHGDVDVPILNPAATVGFHDLTFIDFSSAKFALIAKSACERHVRWPSSNYHIFQCRHCKKAFPSSGSLKMHTRATHQAFATVEKLISPLNAKKNLSRGIKMEPERASTCNLCHAAFPSHHQLELHCLRHQAAEQCATPYSTVEVNLAAEMDPATADLAPQLNKENFLALFELQSRTKDAAMPALASFHRSNSVASTDEEGLDPAKRKRLDPKAAQSGENGEENGKENGLHIANESNNGTADFADIQSMIAVTSSAAAIPSMMMMGSSPVMSRVASPPPSESPASPRLADSVTASPELPAEHNNTTAPSVSDNRESPAKSSSTSSLSPASDKIDTSGSDTKKQHDNVGASPVQGENGKVPREFACNQCPRVLPNLRALKAHNRIHLGWAPFHCNVCSFVSSEKSTLMRHLRTHNGERPYMCTLCQYAFTTKANCERHLRTKHGRKDKEEVRSAMRYMAFDVREGGAASCSASNACPHCNLQFAQAKLLKQHLHVQHNDMYSPKPFACLECKHRFSTHAMCLRHISKHHVEVQPPEKAVCTTLTSLTPYSLEVSSAEAHKIPGKDVMGLKEAEPIRSQSADDAMIHINTPYSSTSHAVTAILDLSPRSDGFDRPASHPGVFPSVLLVGEQTEPSDRPLDPNETESDGRSSLESLISLTTSHTSSYDAPPQDQPLDLALYPMDLSYNSSSADETLSQTSALSPMDLSASPRQTFRFNSSPRSASFSPLPPTLKSGFRQSSPSPFQSRAPAASFITAQKVPAFPIPQPAVQHLTSKYSSGSHLGARSNYSTNGIMRYSSSGQNVNQPCSLSPPSISVMTSLASPVGNHTSRHLSGGQAAAYSTPKAERGAGNKGSGSSRGHAPSSSSNSFLLKKQKQRRYRTERPFRCAHCAAGFTLRSNMERHVKQQHPEFWASKARGRRLVAISSPNSLPMVKPSISISPINPPAPEISVQLLPSTPAFPELLHMMQADAEANRSDPFRRNDLPKQRSSVLSSSVHKSDSAKTIISSEVKQALSNQIKQRKSNLEMSMATHSVNPISAPESISAIPTDDPLSSISDLVAARDPVVKVVETVFPPTVKASRDNPAAVETHLVAGDKIMDETEDNLPDLASVSKLLDTANQQNIQEMFRHSEVVDDRIDEERDPEGYDPFKPTVVHTQTKDDRYLFHEGNAGKFTPVPADELGVNESPTKSPEKSKEGKRSAYNSAPNRVACPYCHRLFPWTSSLRRHILTHTGQKPHKCPCCPLWFTTKSNCDRHLARKHSSSQQSKSNKPASSFAAVSGGVGSTNVSPLPDCTARNAPDRPYRCHFCLSSTFSTPKNLQKHLDAKHPAQQGPLPQATGSPQSLEALLPKNGEGTEPSGEVAMPDQQDSEPQSSVKLETSSDANSNSGSEQCWGESEESGEDAVPSNGQSGDPLYFCFVCLKSFAEREQCLQHLRIKHPAEHAQLAGNATGSDNASESDDAVQPEQKCGQSTNPLEKLDSNPLSVNFRSVKTMRKTSEADGSTSATNNADENVDDPGTSADGEEIDAEEPAREDPGCSEEEVTAAGDRGAANVSDESRQ